MLRRTFFQRKDKVAAYDWHRTNRGHDRGRTTNPKYQGKPVGDRNMTEAEAQANAQRNKENYLKAKAAFNEKNMAECMSYYALDHQIRSRPVGPGREHIEQFLSSMHDNWSDLKIVVDHAIAERDWVAGRCTSTAIHSKPVMGVAPTNKEVRTTFWDMHRFNADGKIAETWNVMDSVAIMQQLGLLPSGT
jgi:predicted ester cyclase